MEDRPNQWVLRGNGPEPVNQDSHLCRCVCGPGSSGRDIRLHRRHVGAEQTGAGGPPLVSGSRGSPRPGVPHRTGRRGGSLGEQRPSEGDLAAVKGFRCRAGSHCGMCPERTAPPRRPPHTDPGAGGVHWDRRCTGTPMDPSRRCRSCGRLRGQRRLRPEDKVFKLNKLFLFLLFSTLVLKTALLCK